MKDNIKTYYNLKCCQCKSKPLYKDINKNILFCGVCGLIHEKENKPIILNNRFTVLNRVNLINRVFFC